MKMKLNCVIKSGAINQIAEYASDFGAKKAFLVADLNTYPIAGEKIIKLLDAAGIDSSKFVYMQNGLEPDEEAVGSLMLNYDNNCDLIIGIGSGVINDLCKLLASLTKNPYIIVSTAPSMDGYASPLSSMVRDGLKVSIPTKRAELILADIDIIKNAPLDMLKAGLGDMLAKYVSICEWRLGAIITGEFFDVEIANSVRAALKRCVDNAQGLLKRDEQSVCAVFEGLVITGEAMEKAGVSRPASGAEHYFSHLWDMRGLEFGTPVSLHGLQCGTATLVCVKLYHQLKSIKPDKVKALKYVEKFEETAWNDSLRKFLGSAAEPLIDLEKIEKKYDKQEHKKRLELIIDRYDDIVKIIDEELPSLELINDLFNNLHLPIDPPEKDMLSMTVMAGKDIRNKYVLPRLLWDLGILEEFCNNLL